MGGAVVEGILACIAVLLTIILIIATIYHWDRLGW